MRPLSAARAFVTTVAFLLPQLVVSGASARRFDVTFEVEAAPSSGPPNLAFTGAPLLLLLLVSLVLLAVGLTLLHHGRDRGSHPVPAT